MIIVEFHFHIYHAFFILTDRVYTLVSFNKVWYPLLTILIVMTKSLRKIAFSTRVSLLMTMIKSWALKFTTLIGCWNWFTLPYFRTWTKLLLFIRGITRWGIILILLQLSWLYSIKLWLLYALIVIEVDQLIELWKANNSSVDLLRAILAVIAFPDLVFFLPFTVELLPVKLRNRCFSLFPFTSLAGRRGRCILAYSNWSSDTTLSKPFVKLLWGWRLSSV